VIRLAPPKQKRYPRRFGERARKECTGRCGKLRSIALFRILKPSGYRQGMCVDCERAYERDRWQRRSAASKLRSTTPRTKRASAA
jgi:hypothetical protein